MMSRSIFMFNKSDKKITSLLASYSLVMLLLAPSAYAKELVAQSTATAKKLQDNQSVQDKETLDKPAQKQSESTDQKDKQLPAETDEKQDCDETNCEERQIPHRPNTPLGARISDALTRQDREAAVDILEHERILLNDEMNLLFLAGRKNEAADIAFILLERSSQDESLYEQAAPILFAHARTAEVMTTYYSFDSYSALNTEFSSTGHPMGRLKFDFSLHRENRRNVDTALLASAPDEGGGELALHQSGDSYEDTLKLQTSQVLNTQTGASLNHQHQIGSRLKLATLLAYNQMATENAAMRLIGRSNLIAFESSYTLDGSNQWVIDGGYHQYQTIDGQELGSGNLFSSTLSHELSSVHPALHTRMTGTLSQFKTANQAISGKTADLIPSVDPKTAAFFMPQDVSEIAAYVSIGDATDNKLPARSLEYRAEIGAFDNPTTGPGWRASAGLAGRVIGADRLHLFMRYDQSPSGQGVSSWEAGLAYVLFY